MKSRARQLRASFPSAAAHVSRLPDAGKYKPYVVRLLNMKTSQVAERLELIVEAFQRAYRISEAIRLSPTSEDGARRAECAIALKELNALLSGYRWHPYADADPDFSFHIRYGFRVTSHEARTENQAVAWITRHIGDVCRIRRCARVECRKWYWAATQHQKYCGDNCRKQDASQGQSFKEKRRIYMKKYRIEQAARDKRAKQLARGK